MTKDTDNNEILDLSIMLTVIVLLLVVALNSRVSTGYRPSPDRASDALLESMENSRYRPVLGLSSDGAEVRVTSSESAADGIELLAVGTGFRPSLDAMTSVIASPIVADRTNEVVDAGTITIAAQLQRDVDENALLYATLGEIEPFNLLMPELLMPELLTPGQDTLSVNPGSVSADNASASSPGWGVLSEFITSGARENGLDANEDLPQRNLPPERINRPELPPVQRARPIERISVLPPRIQPMPL